MANERIVQTLRSALTDLYSQRKELEAAIASLEGLVGRKEGRVAKASRSSQRSTRGWTAAKRKAAAERMRRYWAARKTTGRKSGRRAGRK
jgi:hypothetical protein